MTPKTTLKNKNHLWGALQPENYPWMGVVASYEQMGLRDSYLLEVTITVAQHPKGLPPYRKILRATEITAEERAKKFREMVGANARELFEYDPRIGTVAGRGYDGVPFCPLFDPPGHPPAKESKELFYGKPLQCSVCQSYGAEKMVWCGGNVLWAHRQCAVWLPEE